MDTLKKEPMQHENDDMQADGRTVCAAFSGEIADEVIKAQDKHLKDAVAGGDESHREAHEAMKGRWKTPLKGMGWYRQTKKDFAALPDTQN